MAGACAGGGIIEGGSSGAGCVGTGAAGASGAEASGAATLKPHASIANDRTVHAERSWKKLRGAQGLFFTKQVSVESEAMMGMADAGLRG